MRKIGQLTCIVFTILFTILIFSGCKKNIPELKSAQATFFGSFRDIPGVTGDEIKAIEALQKQNRTFSYGVVLSTEAFIKENGEIGGYSALFCEWLTELFGIRFEPGQILYGDLFTSISSGKIDFSGDLRPTEERRQTYFMTEPIALRSLVLLRIKDSQTIENISLSRLPRYAFLGDSISIQDVAAVLEPGSYETIIPENPDGDNIYQMLRDNEIDAFIMVNSGQYATDRYDDIIVEYFFPFIFSPISLTTGNPELAPIISVVDKALNNGAVLHLNELYKTGHNGYKRNKFFMQLSEEERDYLRNASVIPIGNAYYNYPVSSYNDYEKKWEGISIDVLKELEIITGLTFEVVNKPNAVMSDMLPMLEDGRIYLLPDFHQSKEREGRFIWPNNAFLLDQYALISKGNFPKVDIHDIPYARIGIVKESAAAELFKSWFPNSVNTREYFSLDDTLKAMERGEIDLMMYSKVSLLASTNYYELSDYKVNFLFNYFYQSTFGINKDQTILCSIIDKALSQIHTETIAEEWVTKTYDYQSRLLQERQLWLIGAIVLSLIILALISAFFIRSRMTGKRLEELVKLRTSEFKLQTSTLQTMIDSLPDVVFCKDVNLKFTMCNKFLLDYFGLTRDNVIISENLEKAIMSAETASQANYVDRKVISERQMIVYEEWLTAADGTSRLFETIKAPLMQDGAIAGLVGIARDITDRKAVEEAANAASRSKSAFLANMSHEMRTPMNVVVGLTDLMLEDDDPTVNLKDNLKKISTAANTLLGLINDVLDISKIEAGKLELMPVQYDVPSLLNDVMTLHMIRVEDKPVSFRLDINKELPCSLFGDDLRIKQIINNLLSNAFKYTQKGTIKLGVSCLPENPEAEGKGVRMSVYVSDTGIGIRKEDLKKLFTNYSQVDTRANRRIEGTGLGLSITKMLVEMMDGEISVESEYGKGTIFRFYIRQGYVSDKTIGEETSTNLCSFHYSDTRKRASERLVRPDLSYATVLVVDDMPTNLDVAAGMLKKYKMRVDCVGSGQEAINRIEAGQPVYDAIFMDHMMPDMDGLETTERLRAIGTKYAATIPVIALTANAIAGNEEMFLSRDFQGFLSKPINIMNLDSVVQRWVRNKEKE